MIYKQGKEITSLYFHGKTITGVYVALKQVWRAIYSCLGLGYWVNEYPWLNYDVWKN